MYNADKFQYIILPEKALIINSCLGTISFDDIIEFQIYQSKDKNWDRNYNVLTDLRNATMSVMDINVQTLSKFPRNLINRDLKRKSAHLTDNPNHIVFHTLLDVLKAEDVAVDLEAFSTLDAALLWLGVGPREKENINRILVELLKNRKSG